MSAALARRYYVRGNAELGRAENEAASESFRAAMDLHPSFMSARIAYAVALARMGDIPRASQALRAGLGRATTERARVALLLTMGDVFTAGGDFFAAEDSYRQVLEVSPNEPAALAGIARVYAKLGRYADAFASLLSATRPPPPR